MSLPGDENPNPQWQRPKEQRPQRTSGDPLGGDSPEEASQEPRWQSSWQQPPPAQASPWQQQPPPQASPWQQAPQGGPQPVPGWVPPRPTPGRATAALILGIVGLVLCPLVPSILAIVFGHQSKREIDRAGGRLGGRGLALTGLILGWIGAAFWGLFFVAVFVAGTIS